MKNYLSIFCSYTKKEDKENMYKNWNKPSEYH